MKDPDSKTDKALRWGQYVVEHFDVQPGSMVLITHSGTTSAQQKAEQMADALESALDKDDRRDEWSLAPRQTPTPSASCQPRK